MEGDWQNKCYDIKDRVLYLLQSKKLSDCHFLVGPPSNQRLLAGHQLMLAMASPVFERMFYGGFPYKSDPIPIPDVDPDAFHAMLEFIYTDCININSFDEACGLYYVAKKYMLSRVAEKCTHFLLATLSPQNACRAYELANLFEEPRLMKNSMNIIAANIREVVADPSFTDIEVSTLMAILDQDRLNVDSELDLFNALLKYATERGAKGDGGRERSASPSSALTNDMNSSMDPQRVVMDEGMLLQALKKIRFLTLTPQQFASGPARSKLLQKDDVLAILMNISCPNVNDCPLSEGFCSSRCSRVYSQPETPKNNSRQTYNFAPLMNMMPNYRLHGYTVCSMTLESNRDIWVEGVTVPTQLSNLQNKNYTEELCAQIQDMQGSQLGYMRYTPNVSYNSEFFIDFKDHVYINAHKKFKLFVVFYKTGVYPTHAWDGSTSDKSGTISFKQSESVRGGFIRNIVNLKFYFV